MKNILDENSILRKAIGVNMRNFRVGKGLSLEEVSELLDISPSYLGMVERGQRGLRLSRLLHFAEMFEITIDELLKNKDEYAAHSQLDTDSALLTKINFFLNQLTQEEQHRLLIIIKAVFPCKIQ